MSNATAEKKQPLCVLVSFDLESTGLQVFVDQITEIGACAAVLYTDLTFEALKYNEKDQTDFVTYVKCSRTISQGSKQVTKITEEKLASAPNTAQALHMFGAYLCKIGHGLPEQVPRILVAYNGTKFDVPMCIAEMEHKGINATKFMRQWRFSYLFDPVIMARDVCDTTILPRDKNGKACFKLGGVFQALCKRPLIGAHGALADCAAVLEMILEQDCFKQALVKDVQSPKPKYLSNLMTLVTETVKQLPKTTTESSLKPVLKKARTLDSFFKPAATTVVATEN